MSIDESLATDPFGRFLIKNANEWREIGVQAERERIIKLLEFELWEAFQKSHNEQPAWATMGMLVRAIKGESK
jgi:hypothetical protein